MLINVSLGLITDNCYKYLRRATLSQGHFTPCPANLPEQNQWMKARKASKKMCAAGGENVKATGQGEKQQICLISKQGEGTEGRTHRRVIQSRTMRHV